MPLFTIIVSGYQNEPFLPQCLASISSQTYGDFEAICYVEESTDNSLAICQEWATRDARFTVVTGQKSGSASATRNYGIEHAAGEYLVVIDGDDCIAMEMLERLAAKLKETGPLDILAFATEWVFPPYENNNHANRTRHHHQFPGNRRQGPLQVFSGLEAMRHLYPS